MVAPLIMIGAQVIASGMVLVVSNSRSEISANTIAIDNISPAADRDVSPSRTTSAVFGACLAALVCWLYSQFDLGTAMGAIFWACVHVADRVRQGRAAVLSMRDWTVAYAAVFVKAWPFLTVAVLWVGGILSVTLRDISHKSLVSMAGMVLGLGLLYMMFLLKKLHEDVKTSQEDVKTSQEDIRRRLASLESLLRDIVDSSSANAASAQSFMDVQTEEKNRSKAVKEGEAQNHFDGVGAVINTLVYFSDDECDLGVDDDDDFIDGEDAIPAMLDRDEEEAKNDNLFSIPAGTDFGALDDDIDDDSDSTYHGCLMD